MKGYDPEVNRDNVLLKSMERISYPIFILVIIIFHIPAAGSIYTKNVTANTYLPLFLIIYELIWHNFFKKVSISFKIFLDFLIITTATFLFMYITTGIENGLLSMLVLLVFAAFSRLDSIRNFIFYTLYIALLYTLILLNPKFSNSYNLYIGAISFISIIFIGTIGYQYSKAYRTLSNTFEREQEEKTKNEELKKAKDNFIDVASKKLKSPISQLQEKIIATKEKNSAHISGSINEILDKTIRNSQILKELSENLLNISNLENQAFNIEILNLKNLVSQTVEMLSIKASEKKINIIVNIPDDITIRADKGKISEVIRNLIDNAIKYTNSEGSIQISAHKEGNLIVTTISDNGIGIPKQDIPHIFEEFYRASNVSSNTKQGYGLGLYLVKQYVEKMGGNIHIDSEYQKGTSVIFSLQEG